MQATKTEGREGEDTNLSSSPSNTVVTILNVWVKSIVDSVLLLLQGGGLKRKTGEEPRKKGHLVSCKCLNYSIATKIVMIERVFSF
jgi:hypothetical protein